jgi:hypothetical protein
MREDWESENNSCEAEKEVVEPEMESWEAWGNIGRGDTEAENKGWEAVTEV